MRITNCRFCTSYSRIVRIFAVVVILAGAVATTRADVFVTKTGEEVEGELIETLEHAYRIRTFIGIIDLEKDRVERIIKKKSPWAKYESRRKRCEHSADAHYQLALWCKKQKLDSEYKDELERAIEFDPDHELARTALGYERNEKGRWVKPQSSRRPDPGELAEKRRAAEEERLVRKLLSQWFVKVKAIHKGRLTHRSAEKFSQGREQILAIRDPLAIPAITGVLSTGNSDARRLMVESLAQFREDEATMNLLVATLLDPDPSVRRSAAEALLPRKDDRVVGRLRDALGSEEEAILRNAAVALGVLKARAAAEDLIAVLSKEVQRKVIVSRPAFLDGVRQDFGGVFRYNSGRRIVRYQPSGIGVLGPGTLVGTISSVETQTVSIYRTEVQEALIAITGENLGFDPERWRTWLKDHP